MSVLCEKILTVSTKGNSAYWPFDEASGSFLDSVAGVPITRTSNMTTVPGIIGNACQFAAGNTGKSQVLSIPFFWHPNAQPGISIWCWIKRVNLTPGSQFFVLQLKTSGLPNDYAVFFAPEDAFDGLAIYTNDGGFAYINLQTFNGTHGPPHDTNWHFCAYTYTGLSGGIGKTYVDGNPPDIHPAFLLNSPPAPWPDELILQELFIGPLPTASPFAIDEFGVLADRLATDADMTFLYNGGAGRDYTAVKAHFGL